MQSPQVKISVNQSTPVAVMPYVGGEPLLLISVPAGQIKRNIARILSGKRVKESTTLTDGPTPIFVVILHIYEE